MSLQLLVENAIKHGIGKSKVGGEIQIKSFYGDCYFELSVKNSGRLKMNSSSTNTGVGLQNLQKRLSFNFSENANLEVTELNNHVIASIRINQSN
jgi:LytS/YehU family sensor histidine kinase